MATAREHIAEAQKLLVLDAEVADATLARDAVQAALAHAVTAVALTLQEFFAPADIGVRPIADLRLPDRCTCSPDGSEVHVPDCPEDPNNDPAVARLRVRTAQLREHEAATNDETPADAPAEASTQHPEGN